MTLRTKTIASTCAAIALVWVAATPPAMARWTFHDDTLGEKITPPAGGTRAQTCAGRLEASSGWATFIDVDNGEDPNAFPIPASALTAVDYRVWKAPAGFHNFDGAQEDDVSGEVYIEDANGTRHFATLVGQQRTPVRAALPTPEPAAGNPRVSDEFVFTSAAFSVRLNGVAPGDALGLAPTGHAGAIFVDVTAMDCSLPVLSAKVDVVPGSSANTVHLDDAAGLVPVRVFGSRDLKVRHITSVHLGEAAPAAVPPALASSLQPRDVNGDGRLDRLYYFSQGDTEIMCIDTGVRVTGRTSDAKRFQARSPITTAGCGG